MKTPTQHLLSLSFSVIEAWRDGKASEELAREAFGLVCNFGEQQDVENVCSFVALKLLGTNEVHLVESGEIAVAHDFSGALDCTEAWPVPFDVADLSEAAVSQVKESVRLRDQFNAGDESAAPIRVTVLGEI